MAGDDHGWQGLLLVAHLKLSDRRSIEVKRREPGFQKCSFSVEKPSNVQRLPNGMFGIMDCLLLHPSSAEVSNPILTLYERSGATLDFLNTLMGIIGDDDGENEDNKGRTAFGRGDRPRN